MTIFRNIGQHTDDHGIPVSTRNSVHFFTSVYSICCTELANIPRNCTEFCVPEFRIVKRNSDKFLSV
jgi:hypothetical protein